MGYRGMGPMGNGHRGYGVQGVWTTWAMVHMGNGVLGVWGIWAMSPTGGMGYRGMGHMGNRDTGVWGTRGMGHVGNGIHGQWGTGVWTTWAMGPIGNLLPKYQKDVKLSKRCQVVKCQKMKHLDYGGGSQKN